MSSKPSNSKRKRKLETINKATDDVTAKQRPKRAKTKPENCACPKNKSNIEVVCESFMKHVNAFILPASIEKARMQIFKSQLVKYGGSLADKFTTCSHLIVDDKMEVDRLCRLLKVDQPPCDVKIVKTCWLSACFKSKKLEDTLSYELTVPKHVTIDQESLKNTTLDRKPGKEDIDAGGDQREKASDSNAHSMIEIEARKLPQTEILKDLTAVVKTPDSEEDSDYVASDKEDLDSDNSSGLDDHFPSTSGSTSHSSSTTPNTSPFKLPRGHWVCAHSSKTLKPNYNQHITDKLEEMVKTYQSTNDRWRALGYQKAIQAIRKHPKKITSWEEAKGLPGVGERLADKVWEIAESGELRKLNEFRSSEELKTIALFTDVWGAGSHTARSWFQQGFRTLDDLKTKAKLTKQQKIGLEHYDDFLDRMPRCEVEEIQATVYGFAEKLVPGTICQVCGSYRRGRPTCGDIDILITHPDGKSHRGIFGKLLGHLREAGFLTDDLVSGEDNGNQKKYMGVFKLTGEKRKHRRIDIIVTPVEEFACALVHFTGSAHFNRSIRHLAKKMNMSLSEHALRTGVIRKNGEKIFEGRVLPTPTEESIFQHMGIPYRPPDERDH